MPKYVRSFKHFHLGPTSTQMGCSKHTHLCLHGKQHWSCRTCKHLIFEDIYIKNGLFTTSPITSNVRAFSWSGTTSCLNLHIFAALSLPLSTNVCVKTVGFSFFSTQWYLGLELGKAKGKHSETSNLKSRLKRIQSLPSPKIFTIFTGLIHTAACMLRLLRVYLKREVLPHFLSSNMYWTSNCLFTTFSSDINHM